MASCKQCIHYELCYKKPIHSIDTDLAVMGGCSDFKHKSKIIELPCNIGDTVYEIEADNTIRKWFVYGMTKYDGQEWAVRVKNNKNKWKYIDKTFGFSRFGKTVFLTRKEAEKALKER